MRRLIVSLGILLALLGAWTLWQRGCARKLADIDTTGGAITVRNQTSEDWKNVRIWVNDYYSGTASEIRAVSFHRRRPGRQDRLREGVRQTVGNGDDGQR